MLDYNRKLLALVRLGECCKSLRQYDHSLKFFRKALQYAWHLKQPDIEIGIYDKMGLIYYLLGDLIKARYYHSRFVENRLESENSPIRLASNQILTKFFEMNHKDNYNIYSASSTQILPMILTKLSISMQVKEGQELFFENKIHLGLHKKPPGLFYDNKIITKKAVVVLETENKPEVLIQGIFEEKEFLFEIASPRCIFYINKYKLLYNNLF